MELIYYLNIIKMKIPKIITNIFSPIADYDHIDYYKYISDNIITLTRYKNKNMFAISITFKYKNKK